MNGNIPQPTECEIWPGAKNPRGYGWRRSSFTGKATTAHRCIMEEHLGRALVKGEVVAHSCDTPSCVNVEHLRVATQSENILEAYTKGRAKPTTKYTNDIGYRSPLKPQDVLDIRAARETGETHRSIAERYPVKEGAIQAICSGRNLSHIK